MDGIEIISRSSSTPVTTPRKIFFGRHYSASGSVNMSADWILARKYTPNEPVPIPGMLASLAIPEEQEMIGSIDISNSTTATRNNTTITPGDGSIITGSAKSK
jgi:hypothetical protein